MKTLLIASAFLSISALSRADMVDQSKVLDDSNDKGVAKLVASLSCNFTNYQTSPPSSVVVKAELQSLANEYHLVANSENIFFPDIRYKATSLKVALKYFVFKGVSVKQNGFPIDIVIVEKNIPNEMCGAFQLLDSAGITIDGTLGCCTYAKSPTEEINFGFD